MVKNLTKPLLHSTYTCSGPSHREGTSVISSVQEMQPAAHPTHTSITPGAWPLCLGIHSALCQLADQWRSVVSGADTQCHIITMMLSPYTALQSYIMVDGGM